MRRFAIVFVVILGVLLALFLIAESLDLGPLTDPTPWLDRGGVAAALVGVGLLLVDVVLPVPSSLVMIAHGALFGLTVGTGLSLLGSTGATMVGYMLGRRGGQFLVRDVSEDDRREANTLVHRWGLLAIIVTRPVPLLAETTAIMAGISAMRWWVVLIGAIIGSLPAALLYAFTGALATSMESGLIAFGLVLAMAAGTWLIGEMVNRSRSRKLETGPS